MSTQLRKGENHKIFNDIDMESAIFEVLSIKYKNSGNKDNFFLRLSDGTHNSTTCIVGTQLNWIVRRLKPYSKIRVNRYELRDIGENRKVAIILDLDILHIRGEGNGITENPTHYETSLQQQVLDIAPSNDSQVPMEISFKEVDQPGTSSAPQCSSSAGGSSGSSSTVQKISSLRCNQRKWIICARVFYKSDIISYQTGETGRGIRCYFYMLDESGEIRAVAFDKECQRFHKKIKLDRVYHIYPSKVQMANKRYNSLKNDYEIIFNRATEVEKCKERTNIPQLKFQFVNLSDLENIESDSYIDVIGICKKIDDVSQFRNKTGKIIKKRNVQIVDISEKEVRLTLYGEQAKDFSCSRNSVIAVKGAKVSSFDGRKTLSVRFSSILKINPDIEESHSLRLWYENVGCNAQRVSLSKRKRTDMDNLIMIGEALEQLGHRDPIFFFTKATIIQLKKGNCMYQSCPLEHCKKKIENNNGVYACKNCKKEHKSFKWRYVLDANIADGTSSTWVTLFQDQAESLLGCTADSLKSVRDRDEDAYFGTLNSVVYKEYKFELKVKQTLKTNVESVQPMNYENYNKTLSTQLKHMTGLI